MDTKEHSIETSDSQLIEQRQSKGGNVVRRFIKRRFLGKGGFAKCFQVENMETKRISAIKIVSKETLKKAKAKAKLVSEIKIHKSLGHRNVVQFDHVFEDSDNVYMVLQLCSNHTLNEMLRRRKRITESELQYYLYQIVQALIYTHGQKVIHRDLKLGNIMLDGAMEIKLGDFGLAAKLEYTGEKRKTICGTPNYLAPEIVNNIGHSYEVDVWSLGVIMYTLLYGRPPFETSDVKKTYKKIKECQYTFNEDVHVSSAVKNLIGKVLVIDPSKRLTLEQILAHPFMSHNKIPKQLPSSVLTQAPPKALQEQHALVASKSDKIIGSKQNNNEINIARSEKGISERLLLRTSNGFSRNMLYNRQKEDLYQLKSNPQLLNNNFLKPDTAKSQQRPTIQTVFVKKWVDYSSKYGLGYLLSDGSCGIYFNDATKMVVDESGQKLDYVGQEAGLRSFKASAVPSDKEITKKFTLMQYFKKYLQGSNENKDKLQGPPFVYVKKWTKSDQAILFRLNNKVVQVNFNDKSQVVFYPERQMMLYSSSGKDKVVLDLGAPDTKRFPELSQRLDHIKTMIREMSGGNAGRDGMCSEGLRVQMLHS